MSHCHGSSTMLALAILAAAPSLPAQQFDVVSVKPNLLPLREGSCRSPKVDAVRVSVSGCNLRALIRWAYDTRSNPNEGGPAWIDSSDFRYDIDAVSETAGTPVELRLKFRALLADRFQLKVRQETQVRPGYALVIAKGGAKLTEVEGEPLPRGRVNFSMVGKANVLTGTRASTDELASWLRSVLNDGHDVVNETGLTHAYDFKLSWIPDADLPTASVADALQQLGLRLQEKKVQVAVLIVERAEKPSANQ